MNINNNISGFLDKSYNLEITTSSGDFISLDMSKQEKADFSKEQKNGSLSQSFSYSLVEEFNFTYEGNGIDENDLKEIKQVLENSKPIMQEFMQSFSDEMKSLIPLNSQTLKIADLFSPLQDRLDENSLNFAKKSLVKNMEDIVKSLNNKDLIKEGEMFLKKLFENMEKEELFIYA